MAKEFSFELIRGDTKSVGFEITDEEGKPLELTEGDEIYFTLKNNYNTKDYVLQKKYTDFTLRYDIETSEATITLEHDDTCDLAYGTYVYDVKVKIADYWETVFLGEITLNEHSTWKNNE